LVKSEKIIIQKNNLFFKYFGENITAKLLYLAFPHALHEQLLLS
jgi:hypothetical protein